MKSSRKNSQCTKRTDNCNNKMFTFKREVYPLKDKSHIFKKGSPHLTDTAIVYRLVLPKSSSILRYINMFQIGRKTKSIKLMRLLLIWKMSIRII